MRGNRPGLSPGRPASRSPGGVIVCIAVVLGIYLRAAWQSCRPSAAVSVGAIPPDSGDRDPAYLAYLGRELFLDARNTVRTAWADVAAGAAIIVLLLAVGAAERLLILVRGIQVSCPHDGGCRRFGLPAYACDGAGCDERHRQLSPNRYGVLGHVCRCGTRLPTATVLGRYRLVAYCPFCERPLPGRIGTVPIDHIALIGESAYGKSTLMYMLLGSLRDRAGKGGAFAFVNHWDLDNLNAGLAKLRSGDRLSPTVNRLPHAVMVDIRGASDPGRILYLFDRPARCTASRAACSHSNTSRRLNT